MGHPQARILTHTNPGVYVPIVVGNVSHKTEMEEENQEKVEEVEEVKEEENEFGGANMRARQRKSSRLENHRRDSTHRAAHEHKQPPIVASIKERECVCERERKKERQTDRQTDRQKDRKTERRKRIK